MAIESFLYFNYFSKSLKSIVPLLDLLPFTYTEKDTSQTIELTPYKHSLLNFGNYVFVNPIQMSLKGVKFFPKYLSQKPEIFLSLLAESQKLTPILYIDADYYGAVFMNSWSVSKGNKDILGEYTLSFTYYPIDVLNSFSKNDVQLGDIATIGDGQQIPVLNPPRG